MAIRIGQSAVDLSDGGHILRERDKSQKSVRSGIFKKLELQRFYSIAAFYDLEYREGRKSGFSGNFQAFLYDFCYAMPAKSTGVVAPGQR